MRTVLTVPGCYHFHKFENKMAAVQITRRRDQTFINMIYRHISKDECKGRCLSLGMIWLGVLFHFRECEVWKVQINGYNLEYIVSGLEYYLTPSHDLSSPTYRSTKHTSQRTSQKTNQHQATEQSIVQPTHEPRNKPIEKPLSTLSTCVMRRKECQIINLCSTIHRFLHLLGGR